VADYRVVVKTGNIKYAGTNAKVYITLNGSLANSGERQLNNEGNDFVRGHSDTYAIKTDTDLGEIQHVRIRHDGSGSKPGWFLDYITVGEEDSDKLWYFPCSRWLSVKDDDGLIDRTLDAK
jgi:lipoxygenase homology domain-containing protein 1